LELLVPPRLDRRIDVTGEALDHVVAAEADGAMEVPQEHSDTASGERSVPGDGVVVVAVDERAVDARSTVKGGAMSPLASPRGGRVAGASSALRPTPPRLRLAASG